MSEIQPIPVAGQDYPRSGYSFLSQLADSTAAQISIETAQPKIDQGVLSDLSNKKIMLGVIDLGNPRIETSGDVAVRIRHGLQYVSAERLIPAPDCGMKYLPPAARNRVRQTPGAQRRRPYRAGGTGVNS